MRKYNGALLRALELEASALERRCIAETTRVSSLIRRCSGARDVGLARRVHSAVVAARGGDTFLGNLLVEMHGACGDMEWARRAFDSIVTKNHFSWNTLIKAFAQNGHYREALCSLEQMIMRASGGGVLPNAVTFALCTSACFHLDDGRALFRAIEQCQVEMDAVLGISLINMYGRLQSLEEARTVLDRWKDEVASSIVAWNSLMALYVQAGRHRQALELMAEIRLAPTVITFTTALKACLELGDVTTGMGIHRRLLETDIVWDAVLANMLVAMYGKAGLLDEARYVFDHTMASSIVDSDDTRMCWTTMAAAYVQAGRKDEALFLYGAMNLEGVKPDSMVFPCLISACESHHRLGRQLHWHAVAAGFEDDTSVCNALITMYGRWGCMEEARSVFYRMPQQSVVSWTAIIAATALNGQVGRAIQLFRSMTIPPNAVTCLSLVDACSQRGSLADAHTVHALVSSSGFLDNSPQYQALVNAVVSMYGKCGGVDCARRVFDDMKTRDLLSWDSIIATYAHQGHGKEALDMYRCLEQEGYELDSVTFISVLSALGHIGLVADCRLFLLIMLADHGLQASACHYNCVLDSLGRAGWLEEAMELLWCMPFEPSYREWMTFLASCKTHGDVTRAGCAATIISDIYPEFSAPYLLRLNTYELTSLV